jgi:prepilin-type N-terminal cleavage/methylation domain-containing protein
MKKGVTLIELLVTALILSMGIASMMYSFVVCKNISIRNSHKHNAVQIINQYFEDIQRQESEQALIDFLNLNPIGNLTNGVSIYKKASFAVWGHRYFLRIRQIGTINTSAATNLSVLEATVTWSDNITTYDPRNSITMRTVSNEPNL